MLAINDLIYNHPRLWALSLEFVGIDHKSSATVHCYFPLHPLIYFIYRSSHLQYTWMWGLYTFTCIY